MTKEVLLVYANPVIYPPAPAYGLEILSNHLINSKYSVTIYSPFQESRQPYSSLGKYLSNNTYLFIGISMRNWDEAGFSYQLEVPPDFLLKIKKIVEVIKKELPNTPILIGGSGFSISPEFLLDYFNLNYGVQGPGEHSIIKYADIVSKTKHNRLNKALSAEIDNKELPGMVIRSNGKFKKAIQPSKYIENPTRIIDQAGYYSNKLLGGTVPIRTKIGCPKKCSYCVVPSIDPLLLRNIDYINDDIENTIAMNDGHRIFFADSEFNLPSSERFTSILTNINRHFKNQVKWRAYIYPVKNFNEKTAKLMKLSGCSGISFTVDSFSDRVLRKMIKSYSSSDVLEMINIFHKYKISTQVNLLLGGPEENYETLTNQLEIVNNIAKKGIKVSLNIGLRVYHNTPLFILSSKNSYIKFNKKIKNQHFFSSPLSYTTLGEWVNSNYNLHPNVQFTPIHNEYVLNAMFYLNKGARELINENFTNAEKYYYKSIDYNYEPFRAKVGLARLYLETEQYQKAEMITKQLSNLS